MRNSIFAATLLIAAIAFSFTSPNMASFAPPRWEKLGDRKVNYGLDRDEIFVTASEGKFTAIKIMVRRSGINLHKVAVHYGNGDVDEIEVRENIPGGGESRVINLEGNRRVIQKVVFWYNTKNFANDKAVVELWGRH